MAYQKQSFVDGETVLSAEHLNHIETGIKDVEASIPTVPTTMPNPNALTFTGIVEDTYDGSSAKTINIPKGRLNIQYDITTCVLNKTIEEIHTAWATYGMEVRCSFMIGTAVQSSGLLINFIKGRLSTDGVVTEYNELHFSSVTSVFGTGNIEQRYYILTTSPKDGGSVSNPKLTSLAKTIVTKADIPTKLPCANAIYFHGSVNETYDGTAEVSIPIISTWNDLLDRPFHGEEIALPESTATIGDDGEYDFACVVQIMADIDYRITLNGTSYVTTPMELQDGGLTGFVLGNKSYIGMGDDTGEPFVMFIAPSTSLCVIMTPEFAGQTITLSITSNGYKTLDDKYLSDNIVRKDDQAFQESIVQQVITALGTPVFGRVDENNNIILTGNLVGGTYNLKYEDAEGNISDLGSVEVGMSPDVPLNLKFGKIDSSAGTITGVGTDVTYLHSDLIEITSGYNYTLTMKAGCELSLKVCYWDANGNFLSTSEGLCEYPTTDTDISIPIISGAASFRIRVYNLDYNWNGMNTDSSIRPQYIEYINTMVSLKRTK